MRHLIMRAAAGFLVLVSCASLALAFSTGPEPSRTGAPPVGGKPAEPLCVVCHSGAEVNDPQGLLEILDVPSTYQPGITYPIRVRLSFGHPPDAIPKWGFQIQAVHSVTGDSAGTWIIPPQLKLVLGKPTTVLRNRRYVEHGGDWATDTASVHFGDLGPVEWSLTWQAPQDTARIYFFAAGNAANGDECSFCGGDYIYTDAESTQAAGSSVSVVPGPPARLHTLLESPYPNPFKQCIDFSFEVERAGMVDLAIFDLQGRRVRTIFRGQRAAGEGAAFWNGKFDDGTQAKNGVYFVRFMGPGLNEPVSRRIVLAR
jgi:hypothetical protein